jgi:hypothetical protein
MVQVEATEDLNGHVHNVRREEVYNKMRVDDEKKKDLYWQFS